MRPERLPPRYALIFLGSYLLVVPAWAAEPVPRLRAGPHLLVDDYLIERSEHLERILNNPRRDLAQPVVTALQDKNWQPYCTVLRDDKTGVIRIWYDIRREGGSSIGTLTSKDGIHWERPHRVLETPGNVIFGASVLDDVARTGATEQRYKLQYWGSGMWIAQSADGLTWKPSSKKPVLSAGINDILSLTWDPVRARYLAIMGMPSSRADGYRGRTPNAPEGYRRCVGQSTSKDALTWDKPRYLFKPDAQDEGITEFYSCSGVLARGGLLIGLLKVLRDDLPCDPGGPVQGIGYTVLAWTRDGETWQRDRKPFLDRNPEKGSWDHAMTWGDYQLPVGDEVYLYYGGYARGHKVEYTKERQIGLVRFQRDRYVARVAGTEEGTLRTRLFTCDAESLTVNVDAAKGQLRVQVTDDGGLPFPGFSFADCEPITSDNLAATLHWKKSLSDLRGKTVRLEFRLRQARLFAFDGK
jgi:hypothetical protein